MNRKLMVIGIDGVSFELLQQYSQNGIMPRTAAWIAKYGLKKMKAPLPEVSSVSWTSFATGMNPGEHGTYGFTEINPITYAYQFPTFTNLPVRTIWEKLGEKNRQSVVLNMPSTYPARPLKGSLISGFVALELKRAVFPPGLFHALQEMGYEVDVDTNLGRDEKKLFLKELHRIMELRVKAYQMLKKEPWDLFYFIITGTDRINHFFYRAWDRSDDEYYRDFVNYYGRVDQVVDQVASESSDRGIPVIILSDHGFVKQKQEIYLAQYLKSWKLFDLSGENPTSLKNITPESRVFPLDPSRLYINLAGKFGRGTVPAADYEPLRRELQERFRELTIAGETVIDRVFLKEEIYHGPYLDKAPDLVLVPRDGFDLKAGISKKFLYGQTHFQGMHSWHNAVLIDGCGLDVEEYPKIEDVGRSVENYFAG